MTLSSEGNKRPNMQTGLLREVCFLAGAQVKDVKRKLPNLV